MSPFPSEFVIPFVYDKQDHIKCCWQLVTTGPLTHEEKHWLEYGSDYTVTKITDQDTGGTLTLLTQLPQEAEQLIIRRVTPKTQEIDIHNGGRMTAELIEGIGDKAIMLIQEIAEQVINKDDQQEIRQQMLTALEEAEEAVRQEIIESDIRLAEAYQNLNRQLEEYRFQVEYLINFVVSKHGPLGGRRALKIQDGRYLVTQSGAYLVTAK